jgi:hypothetical protein
MKKCIIIIIMMLTRLELQPSFPHEDISSSDADLLELLLANETLFRDSHAAAETSYPAYQAGHDMLTNVVWPILDNRHRLAAFSYGISAYENIGGLVRPAAPYNTADFVHITATGVKLQEDFVSVSSDSRERFSDELPHVAQVIAQTALRRYEGYTDYALTGAAIAACLELSDITL